MSTKVLKITFEDKSSKYITETTFIEKYGLYGYRLDHNGKKVVGVRGKPALRKLFEERKTFSWRSQQGNINVVVIEEKSKNYIMLDLSTNEEEVHKGVLEVLKRMGVTATSKPRLLEHLRQVVKSPLYGKYLIQRQTEFKPWEQIYGFDAWETYREELANG